MFYDIYNELCKSKALSPSKAALEMGISKGTVSVWKNKGTTPQREILQKIADYFDISIDELLNKEKTAIQSDGGKMKEFINLYSQLSDDKQTLVLSQIRWLLDKQE